MTCFDASWHACAPPLTTRRVRTDFVLTTSLDGHLKLWKKQASGIEFVKHYRAHLGPVTAVSGSADGTIFATVGEDGCKVFDVVNFGEPPPCPP